MSFQTRKTFVHLRNTNEDIFGWKSNNDTKEKKLLNTVVFLGFFAHKMYSQSTSNEPVMLQDERRSYGFGTKKKSFLDELSL